MEATSSSRPWASRKFWALAVAVIGICTVALSTTALNIPESTADKAIDIIGILGAGAIGLQGYLDRSGPKETK